MIAQRRWKTVSELKLAVMPVGLLMKYQDAGRSWAIEFSQKSQNFVGLEKHVSNLGMRRDKECAQ